MGTKLGLLVGFGVGYYLGAKAGQDRYEQMNRWVEKARNSDAAQQAAEKAREVIKGGAEAPEGFATIEADINPN